VTPRGKLYLVGTPIGNLEDISLRSVRVLREVDAIYAEDTRTSSQLLHHHGIHKPLVSHHEHNEAARSLEIVRRLEAGDNIAIITDAGSPAISDPGFRAVRAVIEAGGQPEVVPGPCAIIAALSASGLASHAFYFGGFLPKKSGARERVLAELSERPETLIFYESCHRIPQALESVRSALGERRVVLARELTKKFEEFLRGTPAELLKHFEKRAARGEFVLLIAGASESE